MGLPGLNGNMVLGGAMISVLRQALADLGVVLRQGAVDDPGPGSGQVQDAHTKAFNASNLPLNIGNRGHLVSWIIA